MTPPPQKGPPPSKRRQAILRILGLLAFLVIASTVAYRLGWFNYRTLGTAARKWRGKPNHLGVAVVFVIAFGAGTAVGLPGLPFTIVGGLIYGTALGTSLNMVGALVGAAGGYSIAAQVGHGTVRRWLSRFRCPRQSRRLAGFSRCLPPASRAIRSSQRRELWLRPRSSTVASLPRRDGARLIAGDGHLHVLR